MKKKLQLLEIEQQHLQIVSDFAVDMLSIEKVEQVLWHLARKVVAKLGFDDVVIYMLDEDKNVLIQKAAYGNKNPLKNEILQPLEIEIGQGVVGLAALKKESIRIDDTRAYSTYIADDEVRLSEIAVPMMVNNKVIGVIDSEHKELGFYTQQHQRTLVAIASITATKVQKAQMLSQLKSTIDELEYSRKVQDTLFEITELTFETNSLDKFYQKLHTCISGLIFAKNFYIALAVGNGSGLQVPYYTDEQYEFTESEIIPLNEELNSITGYVIESQQPLLVSECEIKIMIAQGEIYLIGAMPKAWLGVPFGKGNSKGIVVVQSYDKEHLFDEKDKKLLIFAAKHIRNAIERMQAKSQLSFLALHDALTGLPNRVLFSDRMEHAFKNTDRQTSLGLAVFFLDLDKFKIVNDTYGHHVGDKLLIEIAARIGSCLRKSDTLCRLGGDEFAILLENINDFEYVQNIANNVIRIVQKAVVIGDAKIYISTSIGVAFYRGEDSLAEKVLINADKAMYQAKQKGRNQVCFFDGGGDD